MRPSHHVSFMALCLTIGLSVGMAASAEPKSEKSDIQEAVDVIGLVDDLVQSKSKRTTKQLRELRVFIRDLEKNTEGMQTEKIKFHIPKLSWSRLKFSVDGDADDINNTRLHITKPTQGRKLNKVNGSLVLATTNFDSIMSLKNSVAIIKGDVEEIRGTEDSILIIHGNVKSLSSTKHSLVLVTGNMKGFSQLYFSLLEVGGRLSYSSGLFRSVLICPNKVENWGRTEASVIYSPNAPTRGKNDIYKTFADQPKGFDPLSWIKIPASTTAPDDNPVAATQKVDVPALLDNLLAGKNAGKTENWRTLRVLCENIPKVTAKLMDGRKVDYNSLKWPGLKLSIDGDPEKITRTRLLLRKPLKNNQFFSIKDSVIVSSVAPETISGLENSIVFVKGDITTVFAVNNSILVVDGNVDGLSGINHSVVIVSGHVARSSSVKFSLLHVGGQLRRSSSFKDSVMICEKGIEKWGSMQRAVVYSPEPSTRPTDALHKKWDENNTVVGPLHLMKVTPPSKEAPPEKE